MKTVINDDQRPQFFNFTHWMTFFFSDNIHSAISYDIFQLHAFDIYGFSFIDYYVNTNYIIHTKLSLLFF